MVGALMLCLVPSVGVLAHELAHGVVALVLTRGPVHVIAGRAPGRIRVRVGRLHLSWHLEAARGVGWEGICLYRWTPSFRRRAAIAAAGPLADLAWVLGCALSIRWYGGEIGGSGQIALALGILLGTVSAVGNGWPGRASTDGTEALRAMRLHRRRQALERQIGRRLTRAEVRTLDHSGELPAAIHDTNRSVAPPAP